MSSAARVICLLISTLGLARLQDLILQSCAIQNGSDTIQLTPKIKILSFPSYALFSKKIDPASALYTHVIRLHDNAHTRRITGSESDL